MTDLQIFIRGTRDNRTSIRTDSTPQNTLIVCALQLLNFCQGRVRPERHALVREAMGGQNLFRVVGPDERGYLR